MRRKTLLLIVIFILCCPPAFSAITDQNLGEINVIVEGAKRTKQSYIESLVRKCIEREGAKDWDELNEESLESCMLNSRLFSSAGVSIERPEIHIAVKERWTLIPMPYAYSTNERRALGLYLFESNFLGYGKTLGGGGTLSTEGGAFFVFYRDPAVNFSDFTLRLSLRSSSRRLSSYDGDEVNYEYERKATGVTLSPGYALTPSLTASAILNYEADSFSEVEPYAPPEDYRSLSLGASLDYSRADYKFFYNDGFSFRIRWLAGIYKSGGGGGTGEISLRAEFDKALFEGQVLQIALNAARKTGTDTGDPLTAGGRKGSRGIRPGGLWMEEAASLSLDYQIAIFEAGSGVITGAPFVDLGFYDPVIESPRNEYVSYGAGVYYFIKTVNFPGFGLAFGKNENFMGDFFVFQLGVPFF